ncbi:MAG: glycosyltransferase [Bacteroidales bacterium]|nr:glycosyltransferase [Bacteroidales bacterium]
MLKLSIIIPAYDVEAFLPKCLDSIFSQDCSDFEVICVNDGSTDGTQTLLERYAANHTNLKVISQQNKGMSASRNHGLDVAEGEYVMFVDSDDWLCDGALARLRAHLDGEDVVCFNAKKFIEQTGEYQENKLPAIDGGVTGWEYFNKTRLIPTAIHFVCIWQRAYRRSFLESQGLLFEETVKRAEDDLFTTMVMYHAQTVKAVDECVYVYRIRPQSITTTVSIDRWYDSIRVQEMLADFFIPKQDVDKTVIYQVLASNYINYFSQKTKSLYGNRDHELKQRINWDYFRETCVIARHRRLFRMIRFSPVIFRWYERMGSKVH